MAPPFDLPGFVFTAVNSIVQRVRVDFPGRQTFFRALNEAFGRFGLSADRPGGLSRQQLSQVVSQQLRAQQAGELLNQQLAEGIVQFVNAPFNPHVTRAFRIFVEYTGSLGIGHNVKTYHIVTLSDQIPTLSELQALALQELQSIAVSYHAKGNARLHSLTITRVESGPS